MALDVNSGGWTSAQLLAAIRLAASLPDTASDWTDAVLLARATEVIQTFATWALTISGDGRMSEMFNRSVSAALSDSYRASSSFDLPPLAVGDTIEGVTWVDSTGTREHRLAQIEQHEQSNYDSIDSSGEPRFYALVGGRIRVYPQPTTGGIVRFNYQRRHPDLIADGTSTLFQATNVLDLGAGYTRWTFNLPGMISTAGDFVDIINGQYPYRTVFSMVSVSALGGGYVDLFVPYSYVSALSVSGMRIVKSGQSPYVSLPLEMKSAIHDKTAAVVLEDIGDLTMSAVKNASSAAAMQLVMQMLNPRTRKDRKKAVYHGSIMRGRLQRNR